MATMDRSTILFLASQYGILLSIARHLSTLDLLNLALACRGLHTQILASDAIFKCLKRIALCDGRGLRARQEFTGIYDLSVFYELTGHPVLGRTAVHDEEIEVRVWNLKCDATKPLPCLRCGVNVCEECRYVPRERDIPYNQSRRRPHLEYTQYSHNIVCLCAPCDGKFEQALPLTLNEFCDCDQYTRWICLPCKNKEELSSYEYYTTKSKGEWEVNVDDIEPGMVYRDNQYDRYFWCPCGTRAPSDGNVRCAWCMRRHDLDTYLEEDCQTIPFFDDDPCYPKIFHNRNGKQVFCADLGYRGPIWQKQKETQS